MKVNEYETLIEQYLTNDDLELMDIINKSHTSYEVARAVYIEWKNYHDELYWHNAIYEISYMDEVPTSSRIAREFHISYYFASKLLDYYLSII